MRIRKLKGRIGHIYPIKRRIGHIYPLKRLGDVYGSKGQAKGKVPKGE